MSTEQVPLNPAASGLALLVVDSRVHHEHTDNAYGDRRRACEQATSELGLRALRDVPLDGLEETLQRLSTDELRSRVRHVVTDNARTRTVSEALCRGDWTTVGQAMTASHASMRDDYEISCPELDLLVDAALDAGASGARMTGGGFGGCAVVLTRADLVDTVSANVQKAFARAGYDEPRPFVVRPSAGARRLS
jgi:galactokinase